MHRDEGDMPDGAEHDRLVKVYEQLRLKLLDLTKKNRMLNTVLASRSKRQLQVYDEVIEEAYRRLVAEEGTLRLAPLPEPEGIPPDEKTEEFVAALAHARVSDVTYLTQMEAASAAGTGDEATADRLDRELRDRVREALELPPRPRKTEINRAEHARSIGIDPSPDLPPKAARETHADNRLQTLRYPEELAAAMETIADEARLAEQEAGLSTLFLTFGFLEWYESETSDRPYFAPLLLLPVRLREQRIRGRSAWDVEAREGAAEVNVSLKMFLETKFGRTLPDFVPADSDETGSVEAYFSEVAAAVDGLKRWRVRRWLVLGHFAFSRIAIYEDTRPEQWPAHPVESGLVGALLRGFEETEDAVPSFTAPPDYAIDDPEVERDAPFLIHDADASQHSALVDVMRGKNLVIQGPPGTGKSQTITNIIANALAAGRRILFLSEKQAALDVVKRRLDMAGLGAFCLELHSDRAAPRAVIESLRRRHELGTTGAAGRTPLKDPTHAASRTLITGYLDALHEELPGPTTPFRLIWQAIRGRGAEPDTAALVGTLPVPAAALDDPALADALRGQIEIFAREAGPFLRRHGHPADSPWALLEIGDVAPFDQRPLLEALARLKAAVAALRSTQAAQADAGIVSIAEVEAVAAADRALGSAPAGDVVGSIAGLDLDEIETALRIQAEVLGAEALAANPPGPDITPAIAGLAARIAATLPDPDLAAMPAAELYALLDPVQVRAETLIRTVVPLRPALNALRVDPAAAMHVVDTVAMAVRAAARVGPAGLARVAADDVDPAAFNRLEPVWAGLADADARLRAMLPQIGHSPWPSAEALDAAVAALERRGLGKLFGMLAGDGGVGETLDRLGLDSGPGSAGTLRVLAAHVKAIAAFDRSPDGALLGRGWQGFATPFPEIAATLRLRAEIARDVLCYASGEPVFAALLALSEAEAEDLAGLEPAATRYLELRPAFADVVDNTAIDGTLDRSRREVALVAGVFAVDPTRLLAGFPGALAPLAAFAAATQRLAAARSALAASPHARLVRAAASDRERLDALLAAVAWLRTVASHALPEPLRQQLMSARAVEARQALRTLAGGYAEAWEEFTAARDALARGFAITGLETLDLEGLADILDRLSTGPDQLADYLSLRQSRARLDSAGLDGFLNGADRRRVPPSRLVSLFDASLAQRRADRARRGAPALARATGSQLDASRETFASRDRRKIDEDRLTIQAGLRNANPPAGTRGGPVRTWTGMHLLANEFSKQRRHTPVRGLLHRAGEAIQALKPCFMMSPLSLAKFAPAGALQFDLLVIDEASQMRPEDALGAMLRARQIVVVGDPRQLPPTSFFDRSNQTAGEEDEDDIDDESILERCQKVFGEFRRLKWHYRSRCESLIRFSNESFYDNSLITFPVARPGSFSIDHVRVDGSYQARRNLAEAERIAEEAVGFMRAFAEVPEAQLPTIGIVAVNTDQRDLIQETLRRLAADDDLVRAYEEKAAARGEPLFVKNLENVQGDERDVILISMTYGKAPGAAAMAQRFGPINSRQGHRRLNVLFSRARLRIGLFTSFRSVDVVPTETSRDGVHVLRRYLEYVESGGAGRSESIGSSAESEFEAEVAERLTRRGWQVELQVGVSGFRIDLAVRHPDEPGIFLAGIECDGARYHSSKSARDRDRIREEVLRGLGWQIVRVWSTDWFDDPDRQTDRLVKQLEELRAAPRRAPLDYRFVRSAPAPSPETVASDVAGREGGATADEDIAPPVLAESPAATERAAAAEPPHPDPDGAAAPEAAPDGDPAAPAPAPALNELPLAPPPATLRPERTAFQRVAGSGPLTEPEAYRLLETLRETVIRPTDPDWQPHRSILRDALVETFIRQRINDRDLWFSKVPQYLRSGTNPAEKTLYLDDICEIIDRIGAHPAIVPAASAPETA